MAQALIGPTNKKQAISSGSISADRAGSSSKKHSNVVSCKILFLIIALNLTNIYFRVQR